jgi:hypothetical protein
VIENKNGRVRRKRIIGKKKTGAVRVFKGANKRTRGEEIVRLVLIGLLRWRRGRRSRVCFEKVVHPFRV